LQDNGKQDVVYSKEFQSFLIAEIKIVHEWVEIEKSWGVNVYIETDGIDHAYIEVKVKLKNLLKKEMLQHKFITLTI